MQLRRLELVGFKTFVDRTELEFHPGITAIVGPNGSGKSNIFDGIRWALGETNARLLRGARMEDVIFSGSASRRATSTATIALTLDNSAGLLPMEFSEVMISRTVNRGGESEFGINGVDCRLRDIQMLFLGTGLGGRSYALIGQGEVDAVLRATPLERRHWLEEAAGLARHKRQRTEAERRLEHARAHLDRVTDIIDELTHQEQALAAQAEAAALHQSHSATLRDLELALYADEARRLLGATRRLAAQFDGEGETVRAAEQRVTETAADAAMAEAHASSTTAAWEQGQQSLLDRAELINQRASEVQALDAQAERARAEIGHLAADVERLETERAALAADIAQLEVEVSAVDAQRAAMRSHVETAEAESASAIAVAVDAAGRLLREQEASAVHARRVARHHSELSGLHARADMLAQAEATTVRRADAAGEAAGQLHQERAEAQRACEDARGAARLAEDTLAAATRALELRRAEVTAAADAVHAAELEEHKARARLASLEEAAMQFLGFEEGVREVLLAAQADASRFQGLRGAVADALHVDDRFRAAIAAALGRRLHCLIVEARAAVEPVVRFLTTEASGRATILSLDALRPRHHAEAIPQHLSIVAKATDVVGAEPSMRSVVEALLGDVVIVSDLGAAWQVFGAGFGGRVVTLDGVLLSPDGVLSTSGRAPTDASVLGRPQTIADLRLAVDGLASRRLDAAGRRSAAIEDGARAEDALVAARAYRESAGAQLADRLQHIARLEAEAARLTESQAAHAIEARSVGAAVERTRAEIDARQAELWHAEEAARQAEARIAAITGELRRLETARDAAAGAVTTHRLAVVQSQGTLDALAARIRDRHRAIAELDARRTERSRAVAEHDAAAAHVSERRDAAAVAYARIVAEQNATKSDVERLAADRVRLRDEWALRQNEHGAAQEGLRTAQGALHKTEVRMAQAEAELGGAAARLQEQYGIALEDAAERRLDGSREDSRRRAEDLRAALRDLGPVNLRAIDEHAVVALRLRMLRSHTTDVTGAGDALRQAITIINAQLRVRFKETFESVNHEFGRLFQRMFHGGEGNLELIEDDLGGEPGLEVIAQLPGKKRRPLVALSGGERSLVALTLIFSMLRVHPSPFCIFDEVEAALDDANTQRFTDLLKDLATRTQVLIITHNKGTMTAADVLYGVTMREPGLSAIVSVRLVPSSGNGNGRAATARDREPATAALPAE